MHTRKPIVAGQFYPGQHDSCVHEINECLVARTISEPLPENIVAGIVPHAGWTFSGGLAALVFSAIKQKHEKVHTFVMFGAAHGYFGRLPAVYDKGSWLTPLGEIFIDEELASAVLDTDQVVSAPSEHAREHSIEVQIPFVQYLFPGAKILPIVVPQNKQVIELGNCVGDIVGREKEKKIVCIASTDLTHYGPRYGFTPMGISAEALKWAQTVNDQKFIDLALQLEPEDLLASAAEHLNACGPGGTAAVLVVAKKLGKTKGTLLAHTTSNDVMVSKMGASSTDSVGYAAIVF